MYTLCMNMTYDKKWVCYKRCPEKCFCRTLTYHNMKFIFGAGFVWFIRLRNTHKKKEKKQTLSNVHERLSFVNVISFSPYQLQITQMRIERKNRECFIINIYRISISWYEVHVYKNNEKLAHSALNLCLWKMKKN